MDTLSSTVLCLLGARLKIYPFSVESGFFLILPRRCFLSKMSKITQILYIVSGPCMVHSQCPQFLLFLVDKIANILFKFGATIRKLQSSVKFPHTIFLSSRRGLIKTTDTFLRKYEYTGHSLDTITTARSLLFCKILATFIVTFLHTFGHNKTPHISARGCI